MTRKLPFQPELIKGVASVVYELFDNTHRWARSDASGAVLDQSIRAIEIRLHGSIDTGFAELDASDGPLDRYLGHVLNKVGDGRIVEISIYDSGPGLAARSLGRSILHNTCLLYTSPSPRDATLSRMPSSA